MKINTDLLPIKAHFFFFFAALGPILPQLNVFGRQLGVSPAAMGMVTAVLPLLWAAAKPAFGYLVDYFTNLRKFVFMLLIVIMTGSYCGLWFLSPPENHIQDKHIIEYIYQMNDTIYLRQYNVTDDATVLHKYNCQWNCLNRTSFSLWLSNSTHVNTILIDETIDTNTCAKYLMDFNSLTYGEASCSPKNGCDMFCMQYMLNKTDVVPKSNYKNDTDLFFPMATLDNEGEKNGEIFLSMATQDDSNLEEESNFYASSTFWFFVVLVCFGTVAFNVANCIGDAVCFDVLGTEKAHKYGNQRAWGTAGYGITALLAGLLVDAVSKGRYKDFTPAFVLAIAFTVLDLFSCRKLNLPKLTGPSDSGRALLQLLKLPRVLVFIAFAVVAGTFDSFIIYYMFWYLEEIAEVSNHMDQIKLIEGIIVAAQSFVGELLFFYLSGRIIARWGHGVTMSVSLLCYALRLALISLVTNPWQLVVAEAIMQGPTYALMYATIVSYAALVAPEGYSATVQGIVAGMDDGLGFALGSLVGGQLYSWAGGATSFRVMAAAGFLAAVTHAVLFRVVTQPQVKDKASSPSSATDVTPEEREKMLSEEQHATNVIYRDTVVPIHKNKA